MNNFFHKLKNNLLSPPFLAKILTVILTIIFSASSILLVIFITANKYSYLTYIAFTLSGLSFAYLIYILIIDFGKIKNKIHDTLKKFKFTRAFTGNFKYRILTITIITFSTNCVIGALNAYLGITLKSLWYSSLAIYYVCLAMFKGSVLLYQRKESINNENLSLPEKRLHRAKIYRVCGIVLLIINVALSVAMAEMIFEDKHFNYPDWTVFLFAIIAFYKVVISIINVIKSKKQQDLTIQAISNINLTDGAVSVLALQTALLHSYGTVGINSSTFNTITSCLVTIVSMTTAIVMLIHSRKIINQINLEIKNGKQ